MWIHLIKIFSLIGQSHWPYETIRLPDSIKKVFAESIYFGSTKLSLLVCHCIILMIRPFSADYHIRDVTKYNILTLEL